MSMSDLIVVAGGNGFVGRALIEDLKRRGHTNVFSASRSEGIDLTDEAQALAAVRGARHVYNLAASVGGIDFIQANRFSCMLGAQININLLKACKKVGVQKYFFASSACVYSSNDFAIRESYTDFASPERGYGWEKLFSEQLCREAQASGSVDTRVARYFTLYGPGDDKKHNHFPAELCKKIARAKILGQKSIDLWGDGLQTRSLLYIDDCVEGTVRLMNSGEITPVNLSDAEPASVWEMANLVQTIAGTNLLVKFGGGTTGVQSRFSDNTKIRQSLGWEPSISLREGFDKTWRYWWDKSIKDLS